MRKKPIVRPKHGVWAYPLNRRRFLRGMALGGAGFLAACAAGEIAQAPTPYKTPTPFRNVASPQAPIAETAQPVEGSISLEEFLEFSSLLTGVDNLDPALGQIYLNALMAGGGSGPTVADAYGAASSGSMPQDVQDLTDQGFFDQEGIGDLANQIILMWYTGIYTLDGEDHVATFVDALAWKALHFTKPLTICGEFGFWANAPNVQISPSVEYTPVPTEEGGGAE